jgi:hypothetical protein
MPTAHEHRQLTPPQHNCGYNPLFAPKPFYDPALSPPGSCVISKPTVLVLGAGSSTHCGYPLGRQLVDQLCQLRGTAELDNLPDGWTRDEVERFLTKLSRSDPSSIDAFLETNRDEASLGKFLIARQLKKREDIDRLFPPHDSGWYRYVFDSLLVDGSPEFEKSLLSIVTFNYDRSLEAYLHARLQARFQLDEAEATRILNQLPIIHVHGILGEYPASPYRSECGTQELLAISQQIQIIHEIRDSESDFCNEMFRKANQRLKSAERIYFLGFGFHCDNLRRFQFFSRENTSGKTLRATTYGMGTLDVQSLQSKLAEMGFSPGTFNGNPCINFFSYVAGLE